MSLLNDAAWLNIDDISETFDTSQRLKSWLKLLAFENMFDVSVTFEVSQPLISSLKSFLFKNKPVMLVTYEVSQVLICCMVALPQWHQLSTANLNSSSVVSTTLQHVLSVVPLTKIARKT